MARACAYCGEKLDTADGRVRYHTYCVKASRNERWSEWYATHEDHRRRYNREWMARSRAVRKGVKPSGVCPD